jgi:chloramphenicol-sensitive protein RarD
MDNRSFGKGVIFSVLAYFLWGIFPIYWKLLSAIPNLHILAYRILFSFPLVSIILFAQKKTSWLKFYRDKRKAVLLVFASLIITINWGLYILAVNSGHTIDTSLGYYINPLISIVMGLIFFKEKLKPLQLIAFALAFAGVTILTVLTGRLPLISLGIAISFALYGLLKKTIDISAIESLAVETLIASPIALFLLFSSFGTGPEFPTLQSLSYWRELPLHVPLILLLCGAVTAYPLYLFAIGAKLLPLSTLGFIQFISPTMTFLTGVFIFKESFPIQTFIAFGFIWTAALLYIISIDYSGFQGTIPQQKA